MGHSFNSLNVHCVFSTRGRARLLTAEIQSRLWPYIGGIGREHDITARAVGGHVDHAPVLLSLPATVAVAKAMQLMKAGSSKWLRGTFPTMRSFAWQEGYGAFSVSASHIDATMEYIANQGERHRKLTFQEEFLKFLAKHKMPYDPRYIWD